LVDKVNGRVLIVDDDELFTEQVAALLKSDYSTTREHKSSHVEKLLDESEYQVVLLDIQMPEPDGITLLRRIIKRENHPEIVMVSGAASLQEAADSIKWGASDFLEKPPDVNRLLTIIKSAVEKYNLRMENRRLKDEQLKRYQIIGESTVIRELKEVIARVAQSDSSVLVWGETGTGKELVASQIHYRSVRSSGPLIKLNCAAIPHELAESELFGHTRGAFTGATSDKDGKFSLADKGTLVLDEIAEMPINLQSKLLRVLEFSEIEKVGGSKTEKVDVRLISISARDLKEQIKAEKFRQDLFYRINTIPVHVPPLRERKEDTPLLFDHFFNVLKSKNFQPQKSYDQGIVNILMAYDWPGNVRELRNYTERLFFLCWDDYIDADFASQMLSDPGLSFESGDKSSGDKNLLTGSVEQFERSFLRINLSQVEGNVSELARRLGMDRGNLYKKLKKYNLL
jgi:two-component system nitrogen regulation response regulator NtrX